MTAKFLLVLMAFQISAAFTRAADGFVQAVEMQMYDTTQESVSLRPGLKIVEEDKDPDDDGSHDMGVIVYTRPESQKKVECTLSLDLEKAYRAAKERTAHAPFSGPGRWFVYSAKTGGSWSHFLVHKEDSGLQGRICAAHEIRDGVFIPKNMRETTDNPEFLKVLDSFSKALNR